MDPATLTVGAIVSLILNKVLDTSTGKLTEAGLEKLNQLRQRVQSKFEGNNKVLATLDPVNADAEGTEETLKSYLQVSMDTDPDFDQDVRQLAAQVYQEIQVDNTQGRNVQQNFGGTNTQINDSQGPVLSDIRGGTINITYGTPPKS
ncbi:MAG: hypothetical protein ACO3NK_06580 [Prochlorotrichaceae cyanobacterium]|jgi:hypothetical protein